MEVERPASDWAAEILKTRWTFGTSFVSSSGSDPGFVCDVEQVSDLSFGLGK